MVVRIASRKSDLARIQAYTVGDRLQSVHPSLEVVYHFRESLGDQNLDDPLWKMPEKGVFTEDFVEDLLSGSQDIIVHSWKDLPTEPRPGLEIAATFKREDVRDLLFLKKTSVESLLKKELGSLNLLTSSPRRIYNLQRFLPEVLPGDCEDLFFESVRGNVPTRIRKLLEGSADGLILAKAGLDRFFSAERKEFAAVKDELRSFLRELHWMVLPMSQNPTAPAQGALAIEIRSDREDLKKLLAPLHCSLTFDQVQTERREFSGYGGGCHQKIGLNVFSLGEYTVRSLQGLTESGQELQAWNFVNSNSQHPRFSREELFSSSLERIEFFNREVLETDVAPLEDKNLWISKSVAFPEGLTPRGLVWAAGLKTWKQLAARGVWVNGCSDSLGEMKDLGSLRWLHGQEVDWLKLGHEQGVGSHLQATYRLKALTVDPSVFSGKKCFFWSSGSQFLRAIELAPDIAEGLHCCGPGHTREIIAEKIAGERIEVFLNHQHWLETFEEKGA